MGNKPLEAPTETIPARIELPEQRGTVIPKQSRTSTQRSMKYRTDEEHDEREFELYLKQ